jgi:hypothetical protein
MTRIDEIRKRLELTSNGGMLPHDELSEHIHHLLSLVDEQARKLEMAREAMRYAMDRADEAYDPKTTKYEASVVTIDADDFYSVTGFVRDYLYDELKKIESLSAEGEK